MLYRNAFRAIPVAIIFSFFALYNINSAHATTETFTSSTTWAAPAGVTSVSVQVWGGGGGGSTGGIFTSFKPGSGGGGGAYSIKTVTVVPANVYTVTVGAGGTGSSSVGTAGGDSWFSTSGTVLAKGGGLASGGAGGAGGAAASGVGDTTYTGGNGAPSLSDSGRTGGGGGGSSAGTDSNGNNGSSSEFFGNGGAGGTAPTGGGAGAWGGSEGWPGDNASAFGGGGGGSGGDAYLGGNGAGGKVVLTYTAASTYSISGTVYSDEGVTALASKTVAVSINGAAAASTAVTNSSGVYSITGLTIVAGDVLTLYIDGATEDAVTVTKGTGADMTGVNLYQDRLITRCDNSSCSLTNANLETAETNADADISSIYSVSAGALTLAADKHIYIPATHTYAPGGDISLSGDFTNAGTYTKGTETVTFSKGSSTQIVKPGSSSFYNITHSGAGTLQLVTNALTVTNNFTNSAGTYDANGLATTVTGLTTVSGGTYSASTATQTFTGGLTVSGGTLTGSSGAIDVDGDVTLSSGTLTAPSGTFTVAGAWAKSGGTFTPGTNTVTFDKGSSTQTLNSGSSSFYNVTHSGAGTLQLSTSALTVTNNFTSSVGTYDANGLATSVTGLTTVSGGTYSASTATQTFTGGLTVSGGTLTGSSGAIDVDGDVTLSSGTLTAPSGTFTVAGAWAKSGGTFTPGTNTVTFDKGSSTQTLNSGSSSFYNISHSGAGTLQLVTNALTVTNNFTNSAGTYDANGLATSVTATTDVSNSTYTGSTAAQTFSGTLSLTGATLTTTGAGSFILGSNVTGNSSSTSSTVSGALDLGGSTRTFTIADGAATNDLSVSAVVSNGGITKAGSGKMVLSGTNTYIGATTVSAGILNIQNVNATGTTAGGVSVTSGAALEVQGGIAVSTEAITLNGTGISSGGALRNISGANSFSGTITLGSASSVAVDAGSLALSGVISGGSNSFTKTGPETLTLSNTATVGNFTISAGTVAAASNTITVGGTWSNSGTFTPSTSTLTLTGTSTFADTTSLYNLTINGVGITVTLGATLNVSNNMTITAGTLDVSASNYAMNIGGNFSNAGTLTPRSGTTTFNGTNQTILGSSTFYNFVKTVVSAATLTFEAGSTQTVNGTLTLQGAVGQLLSLVSSVTNSVWHINPISSRVVSYLSVKDSTNDDATEIDCTSNCTDALNNTRWLFATPAPSDTTAPSVSSLDPSDNDTSVSPGDNFRITFSENVTAVSGKNITIKKASDDSTTETIAADSSKVTISSNEVTINPGSDLLDRTAYYILIDSGAFVDGASNAYAGMNSDENWNFTTSDTTAPTVSTVSPTDDATGVSRTANLVITFDEAVTRVSGKKVTIKKASDNSIVEAISVTGSNVSGNGTSTITVNPATTLAFGTSYYITIDNGAFIDATDNEYSGVSSTTVWSFATVSGGSSPTPTPSPSESPTPDPTTDPTPTPDPTPVITPCAYWDILCATPTPTPEIIAVASISPTPTATPLLGVLGVFDEFPPKPTNVGEGIASLIAKLSGNTKEDVMIFAQERGPVIAATVAAAGVATSLPIVVTNIFPQLANVLQFLGAALSLHRRKTRWGIVVDSDLGRPVAHAVVQVFDAKFHQLKDTQVTNADGQFGFLLPPGKYYVVVNQPGFIFPARKKPPTVLHSGERIYLGEEFECDARDPNKIPRLVIPMDREEKTPLANMLIWRYVERFLAFVDGLGIVLLIVGASINTFFLLTVPGSLNILFEVIYLLLFSVKMYILVSHQQGLGYVTDAKTKLPIDLAIMRLYNAKTNRIVQTRVTNIHGKFFVLVPKGEYTASVSKPGYKSFVMENLSISGKRSQALELQFKLEKETIEKGETVFANAEEDMETFIHVNKGIQLPGKKF